MSSDAAPFAGGVGFDFGLTRNGGGAAQKPDQPSPAERAKKFIAAHEAKMRPLEVAGNLAWWNANTTGKDEDFAVFECNRAAVVGC